MERLNKQYNRSIYSSWARGLLIWSSWALCKFVKLGLKIKYIHRKLFLEVVILNAHFFSNC